jgi:sugar phosphate isomerase/epimerase
MKLAYSAPSPDETQRRRLFDNLKATGYEGVQLKPGDYKPFLDSPAKFLETYPQLAGLISGCIDYGQLNREEIRKVIAFSKAVQADVIVYCHGVPRDGLTQSDLERFAGLYDEIGKESQQAGVRWTLHHHTNQPCMRRDDFDVFFARPRSYGLTVDTAHLVKSGITDIAEIIRTFRHAVANFHMKDITGRDWKVLGEGDIDFAPVFAAMKEIGYTGWVSADEESGGDVVEGMRKCAAILKQL